MGKKGLRLGLILPKVLWWTEVTTVPEKGFLLWFATETARVLHCLAYLQLSILFS